MDYAERLEILNELQSSAESFGTIAEYTEFIRGIVESTEKGWRNGCGKNHDHPQIEGLEFPVVLSWRCPRVSCLILARG